MENREDKIHERLVSLEDKLHIVQELFTEHVEDDAEQLELLSNQLQEINENLKMVIKGLNARSCWPKEKD